MHDHFIVQFGGSPGPLTIDQGAAAPAWLALLPPNVKEPRGGYVWFNKEITDWIDGPTPTIY